MPCRGLACENESCESNREENNTRDEVLNLRMMASFDGRRNNLQIAYGCHSRRVADASVSNRDQSPTCLEFLSKKLKNDVAGERGDRGDYKIGGGKNISECPGDTPRLSHA